MVDLAGLAALVVEDEGAVALMIEDMLLDLGCEIAASAADLDTACELARTAPIDFALLDLNLAGVAATPVAEILRQRAVPFVFSTGYGTAGIPQEFSDYPALAKPFVLNELRDKLLLVLEKKTG
ncbi:response regulator [Steroidobacter agaridevorans]|uniref:Response regulator n=1 Tax=Steroidobacter agaridevorans TaxID=2695856 RepID=A0A829YA77_9GAMM|nr:response regulator [Steroidobacter agaridevorans]GFE79626.1 response regulator [Steroidobacter agaridevorans]GFE88633.1 response regulator [Steroidobacter agaridevorans]